MDGCESIRKQFYKETSALIGYYDILNFWFMSKSHLMKKLTFIFIPSILSPEIKSFSHGFSLLSSSHLTNAQNELQFSFCDAQFSWSVAACGAS